MDTQSKGKEKERKIIQKTAPGTKIYVDRSIVGQNSSFVLSLLTHIYMCVILNFEIGKTSHCTLFRRRKDFWDDNKEPNEKKTTSFFLRDDIKSKFKSHKSFLFLLTGDYLMIKEIHKQQKEEMKSSQKRIFSSQK